MQITGKARDHNRGFLLISTLTFTYRNYPLFEKIMDQRRKSDNADCQPSQRGEREIKKFTQVTGSVSRFVIIWPHYLEIAHASGAY